MISTTHHPNFTQVVDAISPLLRKYPPLALMRPEDLYDWMSWYWNRGTMSWWISRFGEPRGVCLIRLFRHLDQFVEPDIHDPCGEFCFIEFLSAADPIVMQIVCNLLVDRWGPQKIVMWDRQERTENGSPRMYKWDQFEKIVRRLSYG